MSGIETWKETIIFLRSHYRSYVKEITFILKRLYPNRKTIGEQISLSKFARNREKTIRKQFLLLIIYDQDRDQFDVTKKNIHKLSADEINVQITDYLEETNKTWTMCDDCGYVSITVGYPTNTTKHCPACKADKRQTVNKRVEHGVKMAKRAGKTARLEGIINQMQRWEEYRVKQEEEFEEIRVDVSSGFCSGLCAYYIKVNSDRIDDSYFCLLTRQNYKKAISLYQSLKNVWKEVAHVAKSSKQECTDYRAEVDKKISGSTLTPNNKYAWSMWLYNLHLPIAKAILHNKDRDILDRAKRNIRDRTLTALTIQGGGLRPVATGGEYSGKIYNIGTFLPFLRGISINGFYVIEFEEPLPDGKKHTTVLQKTDRKIWYMDPNFCEWRCDTPRQAARLIAYHWNEIYRSERMDKFTVFQYPR